MKFEIKKGLTPKEIKVIGNPGIYDPIRFAVRGAQPYEWLHMDVEEGFGDKVTNSLSNSNSRTKRMFGGEFKIETRIRVNKHDRTIPIGTDRVFFRKVPASGGK